MENFFTNTLNAKLGTPITAIFKDGTRVNYTSNILSELKSDNDVKCIFSGTTGEIIFER